MSRAVVTWRHWASPRRSRSGYGHAELAGARVHQTYEIRFGATDLLGQCNGDIVGGLRDEGLDPVGDRKVLAGVEVELRGRDASGVSEIVTRSDNARRPVASVSKVR